jgi:RHS repeat-associated protein
MNASYSWMNNATLTDNAYQYNGKELNDDFGLNLNDYGARWYDGAVGRWWSVDPMGEKYGAFSSYNYVLNNPSSFIDPNGMSVEANDSKKRKERNSQTDQSVNWILSRSQSTNDAANIGNEGSKMTFGSPRSSISMGTSGLANNSESVSAGSEYVSEKNKSGTILLGGPPYYYNGEKYEDESSVGSFCWMGYISV